MEGQKQKQLDLISIIYLQQAIDLLFKVSTLAKARKADLKSHRRHSFFYVEIIDIK